MNVFENQFVNIPIHLIKDCDNCYFLSRNEIYNIETKRVSKLRLSCSTLGYTINGKFTKEKDIVKIRVKKLSKNLGYGFKR